MTKTTTTTGGRSKSFDFLPTKPKHTAPVIIESFVDDDGDMQHILQSGNTISEANYQKHWVVAKTEILPKNYKGDNILKPQNK